MHIEFSMQKSIHNLDFQNRINMIIYWGYVTDFWSLLTENVSTWFSLVVCNRIQIKSFWFVLESFLAVTWLYFSDVIMYSAFWLGAKRGRCISFIVIWGKSYLESLEHWRMRQLCIDLKRKIYASGNVPVLSSLAHCFSTLAGIFWTIFSHLPSILVCGNL